MSSLKKTNGSHEATSPVFSPTQRESRWLIALVFGGVALRILAIVFQPDSLKTDPDAYVAHAETLRTTGGYNVPGTETPTAFRPPLYPLLLTGLRVVGFKLTVAIGTINVIAGALTIIATWWMARVIGLRGRWAAATAGAVIFDPMLLRYTALPMTETLAAGLLSFAVLQVMKAHLFLDPANRKDNESSATRSAVIAGVCFGLGGLCRPILLVTCAVITLAQVAEFCLRALFRKDSILDKATTVRIIILPALIAGLILIPWIIRNAIHFDAFVPATTHGGYTLLLGNNETFYNEVVLTKNQLPWTEKSLVQWQQSLKEGMAADDIDQTDETIVDRWAYDRALATIDNQKPAFRKACQLRFFRFWALRPTAKGMIPLWLSYCVASWYLVLFAGSLLSFTACFVRHRILAFFSTGPTERRESESGRGPVIDRFPGVSHIQLLLVAVLSFHLLHLFYWTNARMRAPLAGMVCVLAVAGWHFLSVVFSSIRKVTRSAKE